MLSFPPAEERLPDSFFPAESALRFSASRHGTDCFPAGRRVPPCRRCGSRKSGIRPFSGRDPDPSSTFDGCQTIERAFHPVWNPSPGSCERFVPLSAEDGVCPGRTEKLRERTNSSVCAGFLRETPGGDPVCRTEWTHLVCAPQRPRRIRSACIRTDSGIESLL